MRPLTHVILDGLEHAACGFAFDAFDSEGDIRASGTYENARPDLRVTCPECCEYIVVVRKAIKGLILAPRKAGVE